MDCFFCKKNIDEIGWKDTALLKKYITGLGKIKRRDRTGFCAKHQRIVSKAIKRARHFGLLSATSN